MLEHYFMSDAGVSRRSFHNGTSYAGQRKTESGEEGLGGERGGVKSVFPGSASQLGLNIFPQHVSVYPVCLHSASS